MKSCSNCNIKYDSKIEHCLICHTVLNDDSKNDLIDNYPTYKKTKDTNSIINKIVLLVNIVSIIISVFIDFSINKSLSWSLLVSISNIYLIILFRVILSKLRTSLKIINLIILTTLLVVGIGLILEDYHWAIDIFLPFALITNTLTITIIILSRRSKWRDYISFLFISIIMNLLLILLNVFRVTNIRWAVTACFLYGLFTLFSFVIFTPKDLKEEILRRFHV